MNDICENIYATGFFCWLINSLNQSDKKKHKIFKKIFVVLFFFITNGAATIFLFKCFLGILINIKNRFSMKMPQSLLREVLTQKTIEFKY